jgi:aminoglycoside phosphotransferase (APT) family kinase protein
LEEDCRWFGGPFILMEWIPGMNLLEYLRRRFRRVLLVAGLLAEQHLYLHALSPAGFPGPPGPFLDRRLDELQTLIWSIDLDGLTPALRWLQAHRPPPPRFARILHLDFHPVNLMVHEGRVAAVLDWGEADVGDVHADVAMSLVLLRTAAVEVHTLGERLLASAARWALARRYLRNYKRCITLNPTTLRYYQAWAALRRLAICAAWRSRGPEATGYKACCTRYLELGQAETLRLYFQRLTGIEIKM